MTFKRGRKSIYNGNVGDNDSSSSTFPISTSSLSPTSEYNGTSISIKDYDDDSVNNNTQNKDRKSVTKLIRYNDNISSEIYEIDTNDKELQECITKIVSKTLKRKSNDQIIIEETQAKKLPSNVKMWSPDHVKKFLESRMNNSDFNEIDIKKIRDKKLTGRAFLRLTEEKLTRKDGLYELNPSPAEGIMELVEELNKLR
ncbi:13258_t:CDS:2 [Funneliformis mosseae]|uniref:13258_t:CDS:1 n=1 Tax=Funneliformis mosseae TaxID=27381 RepID=A0A9N9FZG0_FUNMO|nr:13258_t:CDS:2 [Funneliformis mosseae]